MTFAPLCPAPDLEATICAAQNGDEAATEALLLQFRPLLRSRMHHLWTVVRAGFSALEWDDVEAQITFLFLSRLHTFRPDAGVYFPHYIEKMLDFDGRAWLRAQRRGAATPFSQLRAMGDDEDEDGVSDWILSRAGVEEADETPDIDRNLALRTALESLSPPAREVVWKCCVLGRTEVSVATELGVSRSAIRNRLQCALQAMREFFALEHTDGGVVQNPGGTTRTGRAAAKNSSNPRREFWEFLNIMAKDEKRPDLVGVGAGRPVLLQGTYDFPATGLKTPELLSKKLCYTVPIGHVLGVRYLRVGSVSSGMVAVSTVVNGLTHRIVPCAAGSVIHVSFAIVDPIPAGSQIEIHIASQCEGTAIIDVGCLQMPA